MRIFHIVGNQASESLLACSIPQLYTIVFAIAGNIFNVEINTNCGLL